MNIVDESLEDNDITLRLPLNKENIQRLKGHAGQDFYHDFCSLRAENNYEKQRRSIAGKGPGPFRKNGGANPRYGGEGDEEDDDEEDYEEGDDEFEEFEEDYEEDYEEGDDEFEEFEEDYEEDYEEDEQPLVIHIEDQLDKLNIEPSLFFRNSKSTTKGQKSKLYKPVKIVPNTDVKGRRGSPLTKWHSGKIYKGLYNKPRKIVPYLNSVTKRKVVVAGGGGKKRRAMTDYELAWEIQRAYNEAGQQNTRSVRARTGQSTYRKPSLQEMSIEEMSFEEAPVSEEAAASAAAEAAAPVSEAAAPVSEAAAAPLTASGL